jgi:hypothetical protein
MIYITKPNPPPKKNNPKKQQQDIEGLSNSLAIAAKKGFDRHLLKSISDDDPVWSVINAIPIGHYQFFRSKKRTQKYLLIRGHHFTYLFKRDSVAHALGSLCATLVLMVSVEKIVISGGVLNRKIIYPKIRVRFGCGCFVFVLWGVIGFDSGDSIHTDWHTHNNTNQATKLLTGSHTPTHANRRPRRWRS